MAEIKLNKTELKKQKTLLEQLTKYLPTLQLKKQQLQVEVDAVQNVVDKLAAEQQALADEMGAWAILLSQQMTFELGDFSRIAELKTDRENIAGVDVPVFLAIEFAPVQFSFFVMPLWADKAVADMRRLVEFREKLKIARQRLALLEEELRQTTIKVNLFEKRMIPQCRENIRKIKIFLGDQEIAAICNAKIAKDKLKRKDQIKLEAAL
jgi:V/A-type H+-transporting ATPase subunit D